MEQLGTRLEAFDIPNGTRSEVNQLPSLPIQDVAELTGLSTRTIREYRERIEKALNRRISKKVATQNNKLLFHPEAVDLMLAWRDRGSDEDFVEQFSPAVAVHSDVVESDDSPSAEYGLTVYRQAALPESLRQRYATLIPTPVEDMAIDLFDDATAEAIQFIEAGATQEVINKSTRLERLIANERHEGEVEGMILFQERRVARASKIQELENAEVSAKHIAQLKRELAAAEAAQGGDAAKAATKSRKR